MLVKGLLKLGLLEGELEEIELIKNQDLENDIEAIEILDPTR